MKIGFTGTQRGMTAKQSAEFREFCRKHRKLITEFHHGDCVGADAEAHDIVAQEIGVDIIWIHPGTNWTKRAHKDSPHVSAPAPNLERNRWIVTRTDALVACPGEAEEVLRSGTWMTIREARDRQKKPYRILLP